MQLWGWYCRFQTCNHKCTIRGTNPKRFCFSFLYRYSFFLLSCFFVALQLPYQASFIKSDITSYTKDNRYVFNLYFITYAASYFLASCIFHFWNTYMNLACRHTLGRMIDNLGKVFIFSLLIIFFGIVIFLRNGSNFDVETQS